MRKHTIFTTGFVLSVFACGLALAADPPLPEHPRPDWQRPAWVNLNGQWDFAFDPDDVGVSRQWFVPGKHPLDRKIVVPFPWESRLSGIADTEYKGVAWYSREITLPDGPEWKDRNVWLVIGACDFEAKVWVNGQPAGENVGGYLPFDVNLSDFAKAGERVTVMVRAVDKTDPQQPTGKQVHWYTRTSGIWQPVYLEARGQRFARRARFFSEIKTGEVFCQVALDESAAGSKIRITSPDGAFEPAVSDMFGEHQMFNAVKLTVKNPKLWSPDSPHLYNAVIELLAENGDPVDRVETYFGIREISIAKAPSRDYQYIQLNGKPVYLRGALHQSFHPEGICAYPDDATVRSDYELCKRIGINCLRIHIKTPLPRELYWADRLGVLIMQDIPCFWKYSEQARKWYEQLLLGAMARDFNHPSVFSWVDFNETWGIEDGGYTPERQKWVTEMYRLTKERDPSRLVEDNSPCKYDHTETDINSWHFYINEYAGARKHIAEVVEKTFPGSTFNFAAGYRQGKQPLMNSEYGGIGAGNGDQDISWCFKFLTNELRLHDKICGYIYTELSDIEWEHNGFVNYDRTAKEYGYDYWHPGFAMKDLNGADFVVIDAPPCVEIKPGAGREIPLLISHWSGKEGKDLKIRWRTAWNGELGKRVTGEWHSRPADWKPYAVTGQKAIQLKIEPDFKWRLGALQVELLDGEEVLVRNYVNLLVERPAPGRIEVLDPKRVALRFEPSDVAEWQWDGQEYSMQTGIAMEKASGLRTGQMTYRLQIPPELKLADLENLEVFAELSAKASTEKLDWPARKNPGDNPQTDGKKHPTNVVITINGQSIRPELVGDEGQRRPSEASLACTLPDDPADARGVLSHHYGHQPGSYGYLVTCRMGAEALKDVSNAKDLTIRFEVPTSRPHPGGLAIFGDRLGRYTMDPTVVLTFKRPHAMPAGLTSDKPVASHRLLDQRVTLIPTAEQGGHRWAFTTKKPGSDWAGPDFNDRSFKRGKGGFGTRETPNAIVGTKWLTPDIWLRTEVDLQDTESIMSAAWRLYHDEDVEVYINGRLVLERKGFVNGYEDILLDAKAIECFRRGTNVIAMHCRQTGGGQNVDLGLTVMRKPKN